jgi:hypothetical protein
MSLAVLTILDSGTAPSPTRSNTAGRNPRHRRRGVDRRLSWIVACHGWLGRHGARAMAILRSIGERKPRKLALAA